MDNIVYDYFQFLNPIVFSKGTPFFLYNTIYLSNLSNLSNLSIYLSIYLSIHPSTHPPIHVDAHGQNPRVFNTVFHNIVIDFTEVIIVSEKPSSIAQTV